eukprot:6203915-Pleurochrysis_carterae.AAC.3
MRSRAFGASRTLALCMLLHASSTCSRTYRTASRTVGSIRWAAMATGRVSSRALVKLVEGIKRSDVLECWPLLDGHVDACHPFRHAAKVLAIIWLVSCGSCAQQHVLYSLDAETASGRLRSFFTRQPSSSHSITSTSERRSVGLLDVFGFESLQTNSLEQVHEEPIHAEIIVCKRHAQDFRFSVLRTTLSSINAIQADSVLKDEINR